MDYGFNIECGNNNKSMLYKIVLCYFVGRIIEGRGRNGCRVVEG